MADARRGPSVRLFSVPPELVGAFWGCKSLKTLHRYSVSCLNRCRRFLKQLLAVVLIVQEETVHSLRTIFSSGWIHIWCLRQYLWQPDVACGLDCVCSWWWRENGAALWCVFMYRRRRRRQTLNTVEELKQLLPQGYEMTRSHVLQCVKMLDKNPLRVWNEVCR